MSKENTVKTASGWAMLPVPFVLCLGSLANIIWLAVQIDEAQQAHAAVGWLVWCLVVAILVELAGILVACGFFTLQPNEARVLLLFGHYRGTARESGFHWANPFMTKLRISLRARNLEGERLKVNDKRGNPIEIGAVVVWRIEDTAQALFDVNNYDEYVRIQSESAVRHLANSYPYDHGEGDELTLRGSVDDICVALQKELQERLGKAGVHVDEARLTHLAYAQEIAQAMLRRQQAEAVIAARKIIVHAATSMIEMALHDLSAKKIVELDEERKAAMVGNLLVVLCGEAEVQPVVNVGTLYH
ncbi:MAG: SPFH domain-containing protein [Planctomycetota bacterium]|nr:SPFH domain-containing protein [Planctomycetota bacterium]